MSDKILVINAGSSSIKYKLFDAGAMVVLAAGLVERVGEANGRLTHKTITPAGAEKLVLEQPIASHHDGLAMVAELLADDAAEITAVGHRVVHGGERFNQTVVIDDEVIAAIRALVPLAPLHNPANLEGIEVARQIFSDAVQVAVFDTAFHQTMPAAAYRYAIPAALYDEHRIRAYGFHGTSHRYVSKMAAAQLGKPLAETNLITAHLGNGASITAVENGRSIDTSMGFGPLAGLVMGTRSGDIDPTVLLYLSRQLGLSVDEIDTLLNKKSGLLGISGSADLRDVIARQEAGDEAAALALAMAAYRIKKYIGAYTAVLGRVDALVFTAGIGENSPLLRQLVCDGLEGLGIALDAAKNGANAVEIGNGRLPVLVIPTDEEREIAEETAVLVG